MELVQQVKTLGEFNSLFDIIKIFADCPDYKLITIKNV